MKQNITVEQLNQLSVGAKKRLGEWWKPQVGDFYFWVAKGGVYNVPNIGIVLDLPFTYTGLAKQTPLPLLSIGRMIEFLGEDYANLYPHTNNLCDILWGAVKEVLGVRK